MNRVFTQREKVLLLILTAILLAVGYMKLFREPLQSELFAAQERQAAASDALLVESVKLKRLETMQAELAQMNAAEQTGVLPVYDNVKNVMVQLNAILSATEEYSLQFDEVVFGEELISRPISMSFTASGYSAARAVLNRLYHGEYRCALSNLTVSSAQDVTRDKPVTVNLTLTFYEAYA